MSQINLSGLKGVIAGEALETNRRVMYVASDGKWWYADAIHEADGITDGKATAADKHVNVILANAPGTRKVFCVSSCSRGDRLFGADDGKVDDVALGGGRGEYIALEASAGGDWIEVLPIKGPLSQLLHSAVATSTAVTASATATTFSTGTKTIDGSKLRAGDVLRIKAAGTVGTATGSETVTVELLVGTEVVATTGAVDPTSADVFRIDADVAVRVAGASGKLQAHGTTSLGAGGTATAKIFSSAELSEDISSAALAITVRVTNSSTGESVTLLAFTVELLRQ